MQCKILRRLRQEKDLTQEELGKMLGDISGQSVNNWENNRRQYDVKSLKKIAAFFDVSSDYLLGLSDTKKPIECLTSEQEKALKIVGNLTATQLDFLEKFVISIKKEL